MVIMQAPMDLVAEVFKDGLGTDDNTFTTLTDPKSPGTG
jgi:hypothetical protein